MKIYTRRGDTGNTGLIGGTRLRKDSLRVQAYGDIDELNACVGLSRSMTKHEFVDRTLKRIQEDLFVLGADLATPSTLKSLGDVPRITHQRVRSLEKAIDFVEIKLRPITHFILPGGAAGSSFLHVARAVCRRAERKSVTLSKRQKVNPEVIVYLNRLSDLLFVLGRYVNDLEGVKEHAWTSKS